MKVMQDLEISLKNVSYDDFYQLITENLQGGWIHALDKEQKGDSFGQKCICFEYISLDYGRVGFTIFQRNENTLFVPNIVPLDKSQLTIQEYNQTLDSFVTDVLSANQYDGNFEIVLSDDEITLQNEIDEESYKKFKSFSNLLVNFGGITHPRDKERWMDFIISTYDMNIDSSLLTISLINEGFTHEYADKLVEEYEFGSALLKKYTY